MAGMASAAPPSSVSGLSSSAMSGCEPIVFCRFECGDQERVDEQSREFRARMRGSLGHGFNPS